MVSFIHPRITNYELKPYHFPNLFFFLLLWIDHFTIGPPSDSGYEYLLKQWIQSGDPKARQQCKKTPLFPFLFILKSIFFRYQIGYRYHQQTHIPNSNTRSPLRRRHHKRQAHPPSPTSLMLPPRNTSLGCFHITRFGTPTKTKRDSSMGSPWTRLYVLYLVCGSGVRVGS